MISFEVFFDELPPEDDEPLLDDELRQVEDDKKSMSVFSFPAGDEGADLGEIRKVSRSKGLLIEEHLFAAKGMAESSTRYVFVFKEESRWRVPAYLLTRRMLFEYGWSDGAEFLESSLLGYSENEIAVWQSRKKEKRLGWEGIDFFLIIDERDAEAAAKLGNRALDFTSNDFSAVAFFSRSNRSVSQAAFALVPERKVLMRAGLKWKALAKIFDHSLNNSEAEVVVATISQKDVVDINRALTTNLHALSPDGWL